VVGCQIDRRPGYGMIYAIKNATGQFPVFNEFKDGKESPQKRYKISPI